MAYERFLFFYVEENVERDAVNKALLSLLRQDVRGNSADRLHV